MKCPECGKEFAGRPALSRKDNETLICPDCGIRQALAPVIRDPAEIEEVLSVVRQYVPEEEKK